MTKKFHLGWFLGFSPDEWNEPFANGGSPWDGEFYVEMAKALERACFDFMMVEDTLMVSEAYGHSRDVYLKHALMAPKHDPAPLAALMTAATRHLGVVITMSTMSYAPFHLARLCSTLDHISRGRFGWNIVTTGENQSAQNFGMDVLPPREVRYEMADEYVELVRQLFETWEPDAVVMDREKGIYADASKVHQIDFKGKYFSSRGPMNTVRSPQGRPAFFQAGGSPRGRDFAAKNADVVVAVGNGVEGMKKYREELRGRAEKAGRDPDDVKIVFCITPTLGETEQEARDKHERMINSDRFIEQSLAFIAGVTDIDFSTFSLDEPLPHLTTNGEQGSLDKFAQWGSGKTLRQLVIEASGGLVSSVELIGTPDQVAEKMGAVMEEVGGDGFLITSPSLRMSRRYIVEVTDGLVPALQRRGLTRTVYTQEHLRDTIKEF
ncbi:NtaA/DmoA family FMN-dependent monooxygenase [Hansschlegelia quercus]|uniref:LLM class flavin-dependent oxidoreductase n=1 Tax=Hansschlegelia quercus TaxID=2528245 RepID=A0A4Q9GFS3_9HYPH|nr:NtaA/DmoA family FMN-dependent monooxygenase [Hansschlegelia quercus]TBN51710.1 LLM class flavin-dependent oxidoreductase [Hansschlegelia quercus]